MITRTYQCEGPDCRVHVETADEPPYLPIFFIETRQRVNGADYLHHFCSWWCLTKYAAAQFHEEVV